jgi:[acyl-carrier-protein] S-malonyltransferase
MGITPSCHCGFSLGELSAYAASGVLDDEQLFTLVQERSTLMGQATEIVRQQIGPLGMAAVVGLGFAQVKQMIEKEGLEHLYCANDNSPFQLTISGALSSIEQASSLLKALGAKRVIPLRVSGPFHTPFMLTVEKQFAKIVHQMDFKEPHTPVYLNVSGLVAQSVEQIIQGCIDQLSQPVRWTQIMQALISEQKVAAALEIGPGKVLGGLWNSLSSGIPCHSCESWETIEATVRELR